MGRQIPSLPPTFHIGLLLPSDAPRKMPEQGTLNGTPEPRDSTCERAEQSLDSFLVRMLLNPAPRPCIGFTQNWICTSSPICSSNVPEKYINKHIDNDCAQVLAPSSSKRDQSTLECESRAFNSWNTRGFKASAQLHLKQTHQIPKLLPPYLPAKSEKREMLQYLNRQKLQHPVPLSQALPRHSNLPRRS